MLRGDGNPITGSPESAKVPLEERSSPFLPRRGGIRRRNGVEGPIDIEASRSFVILLTPNNLGKLQRVPQVGITEVMLIQENPIT